MVVPKSAQPNNYTYSPYIEIQSTEINLLSAPLTDFFKLAIGEPYVYAYVIKVHSYSLSALLKHIKTFKPLPQHLPEEQPKKKPPVVQKPKEQPKKKPPVVQQPKKHHDLDQVKVTEQLITEYFNKFNKKYFGDKLTLPPIKFKRVKNVTAYVSLIRSRYSGGGTQVVGLTFNPKQGYTLEMFKGILLHEMIHIYFGENNIRSGKDGHGKEFMLKRKELQKEAPFFIPLVAEGLEVSIHNNKPKYFDIILGHFPDTNTPYRIAVYKNGLLSNQESNLKSRYQRAIDEKAKISVKVYRSNYLQLQDFVATSKLKFGFYSIKENRYKRAIEHGTILYTVIDNLYKKPKIPKVRTYKTKESFIVKAYPNELLLTIGQKPLIESIDTLEDASAVFRKWIEDNDYGGSDIKGGEAIVYKNGKKFKRVSYNGKIWDLDVFQEKPKPKTYEIVCVKILNKDKGFREDEICFNSYKEAETWARMNLPSFSHDFLYYKDSDKPAPPVKDTKKEPEETVPQTKTTSDYELSSFTHSKTGVVHDLVKILPDIGQANFRKLKSIVKNDYEGFYSRYAKGFLFPAGKGSIFMNFDLSSLDGSTTLTDTPKKKKKSKNKKLPFYLQKFTEAEKKEMIEMGKNVADLIAPEEKKEQQAYMKNPVFLVNYLGYNRFKVYPEQQEQDIEKMDNREGFTYRHGMFYNIPQWLQKKLAVQWFKYFFPDVKRVTANFSGYKGFNLNVKLNESKYGQPFSKQFLEKEQQKRNKEMSEKGKEILEMFNGGYIDHYSDYPWNFRYSVGVQIN